MGAPTGVGDEYGDGQGELVSPRYQPGGRKFNASLTMRKAVYWYAAR